MKYCKQCGVIVHTCEESCPLCASSLSLRGSEDVSPINKAVEHITIDCKPYPKSTGKAKYNLLLRVLLFVTVVAASSCLLVNLIYYSGYLWSLIVTGGIGLLWAALVYPLYVRKNIGHYIAVDAICGCCFFVVAQFVIKSKGWSLDYVIPFLFIAATTIISLVILIKRMKWHEYALYQFITIILGLLPVISVAAHLVLTLWPSIISAFYSFITLAGMLIFADKKYKNELIKRFHF